MAEPREVSEVLDYVREVYSRSDEWPGRSLRSAWEEALASVSLAEANALVRRLLLEHPKFPPTPMEVRNALGGDGPAKSQLPGACNDCEGQLGYRHMAIRWVDPRGEEHVQDVMAACDCTLGMIRQRSGARPWRDQWAKWQTGRDRLVADGGRALGAWYTHRGRPFLPRECLRTEAQLAQLGTSESIERARAWVEAIRRGRDEHAADRRHHLDADRERDDDREAV